MSLRFGLVADPPGLGRRVAGGAGWSLAGRVTVAGLGLVIGVIMTRLLPPEQMGIYLLASSLVVFAAVLAGAGINQLCTRYVAEQLALGQVDRVRRTVSVLMRLGLGCAAATAVASVGLTATLAGTGYGESALLSLSVLLGAWVFVTAAQALVADSFRGLADIRAASVYGGPLASIVVVIGLLVVLVSDSEFTVVGAVALVVAAAAASTGWGALALRRHLRRLPAAPPARDGRLRPRGIFAVSVPLVLTTALLAILASADLWVLGVVRAPGDVAAYGVAGRTATLVGLPLLVVYGVLPPVIAGLHASGELRRLEQVLRVTATAASVPAVLLAVTFVAAGGPLLAVVYGEHYRIGALPFAVLSLGQVVAVLTGACGLVLGMTGHQRLLLVITSTSVVATVGMLLVAAPVWGMTGAAVVSALGLSAQNVALLVAARRATGLFTLAAPPWSLRSLRSLRQVLP